MADSLPPFNQSSNPSSSVGSVQAINWPTLASLGSLENSLAARTRADGQPMQKRGPKAHNKPALTRKQELARKAQRNHRQRKEIYVKALEQELLQLKADVSIISSSYESLEEENRQVKENVCTLSSKIASLEEENRQFRQILEQHGASWPVTGEVGWLGGPAMPDSGPQIFNPPIAHHGASNMTATPSSVQESSQSPPGEDTQHNIDYDQMGIDFVLAIEKPCLCHMRVQPGGELYGHALMASCVPGIYPELASSMLSNSACNSAAGQKPYTLSKSGLASLLERSQRLNLDGEVTPVMVWDMILNHPRFLEFTPADFEKITQDLSGKVKCYGFGAVFEEFEAREVIENIFFVQV